MVTTLAPAEPLAEKELAELEATVRDGTQAFMRVGVALMRIRDGKGYKLRGYKTFEDYCTRQFGITDRHGRRLIAATEANQQIEAALGTSAASESVARELVSVAGDPIVLQKVKDKLEKKHTSLGQASAELVKDVVAAVTGKPRPQKSEPSHPAPKPGNGHAAAAPTLPTSLLTELQAVLIAARSFLDKHPGFKNDADAKRIVGQLGHGLVQLDTLLDAAYGQMAVTGPKPATAKPGKSEAVGAPKCPSCKEPIKPGDLFCDKCGAAL